MLECLFQLLSVGTEIMSWRKNDYMTNINIANLKVGHTYKNWNELCAEVGIVAKTGRSRQFQEKEFKRYFSWTKKGHKITITEIYDEPKEKSDGRKKVNKGSSKKHQVHYYEEHAEIILKRKDMDYVVLIDLEDVEQVITKRWHITEKGYVKSTDGFSLHRFVMNIEKTKGLYAKDKPVVHHVNHSPLDNRKSNLQIMTWEDHVKLHSIEGEGRVRKVEKEVEELVLKLKEVLMENDIDLNSPTLAKAMKHISKYGFEDEKVGA